MPLGLVLMGFFLYILLKVSIFILKDYYINYKILIMDNKQSLEEVTPEALKAQKEQKSRNRLFGLLLIIDLALFGILVYEIIMLATKAG